MKIASAKRKLMLSLHLCSILNLLRIDWSVHYDQVLIFGNLQKFVLLPWIFLSNSNSALVFGKKYKFLCIVYL